MFALQNRAYDVQTVSWERCIFSKLVYFWSENALKTIDCMVVLRHEYVTFQRTLTHTFDTSNSLYESQKAHVYVINILWVIRWGLLQQRQHTESVALVRLSTRCIFSNRQHSFIPRMKRIFSSFLFILCHCFGSNAFAPVHSKFQIQLEYYMKPGKNFMALFLVHVITVFVENFLPLFSFSMIFFLQRIQNCLCNVFS